MTWGFLSTAHILSLVIGILIVLVLYFLLRGRSKRLTIAVLGILSFSGIAALIYNLVSWGAPLEYLPLHLCSLNALVLPAAVFTRNKILNNLLLLWSFGALFALLVNVSVAETTLFSPVFCFYYFPHVLEFGIPILMFALKLVRKDIRCIAPTLVITWAVYTLIHLINVWINGYTAAHSILDSAGNVVRVNYMFSITPDNPLLQLFYKLIPHPYWYMYPAFLLIVVYLVVVYAKEILQWIKARKNTAV